MEEGLSISVVIPALNEQQAIARALQSTRLPGVERIVVDGGSTDGTDETARSLGADRVLRTAAGRARQMDAGFRAASGEAILFLHADTRLDPGWRDALARVLADPAVAGGAFRLRFDSGRGAFRVFEAFVRVRARLLGLPFGDQGLFVRRKLLEELGGVPDVPIFEDLDLVRAIRRSGRLALLEVSATTSVRRYERNGLARQVLRNQVALLAFALGLRRDAVARWYRGRPDR